MHPGLLQCTHTYNFVYYHYYHCGVRVISVYALVYMIQAYVSPFGRGGEDESTYERYSLHREKYKKPGSNNMEIYAQMAQWGYQEIPRASVTLSKKLGEGQFGEVYKAELKVSKEKSLDVAVKLVKEGAPAEERTKLLQEAVNLGQFKHRHVVRLIGVVTIEDPVSL